MPIDYQGARKLLEDNFPAAETRMLDKTPPETPEALKLACDAVFNSPTQAYREALLGCLVARIQDKTINIRQPYARQGPNAFSGRGLDEKVVNRFLYDERIPCSRGPYLSVFRRSVEFNLPTREGLRYQEDYDSLLEAIKHIEETAEDSELLKFLNYVLYKFAELREQANVPLSKIHRISLEQFDDLISGLLDTPSGGRLPVLLVVAAFTTIKSYFELDWEVSWQGINVSDTAAGAGGDITVISRGETLMTAEVTERPVDATRVIATFNTKISLHGIEDYLFFVSPEAVGPDAKRQARQYFAQGHEVNFVIIKEWLLMLLAMIGRRGRGIFNETLLRLLESEDTPASLRVGWNQQIERITTYVK